MNDIGPPPRSGSTSLAGGIFIAAGLLIGAVVGLIQGQPSLGMVIGLGIGIAIAVGVWLFDRR